ncbi:MAG: alternate F1F0 ATPase, F1 subunit alpha [Myxococcota bacterium]
MGLRATMDATLEEFRSVLENHSPSLSPREYGLVASVDQGIARVRGLPDVGAEELVRFANGSFGLALNLDEHDIGVVILGSSDAVNSGDEAYRTGRVLDVPVGDAFLGRVVDPLGRALDDRGRLRATKRRPVERPAPPIIHRAPVTEPLQTGLTVVDAMVPIGRGQRELIVGDRQTGKTAIAIDTIINQRDSDVVCVYCSIGQRNSATNHVVAELRRRNALAHTVVVVAESEAAAGMQFVAPYAATSIAEYFMDQGRDVLIVYDDLTQHARAYREISLLLRRPPGREAYPGDIFYLHSRLLERATHLRDAHGGGSLTALPVIETEAENISAYIPTNLISITDGQIYLSPRMVQKDIMPAVDIGKSVSRVGGKTQKKAYRKVAEPLRLAYSQFEELETFERFGTRLDESTRRSLEHGRRVREVLRQSQFSPRSACEQIAALLALNERVFADVDLDEVNAAARRVGRAAREQLPEICEKIDAGEALTSDDREAIVEMAREQC